MIIKNKFTVILLASFAYKFSFGQIKTEHLNIDTTITEFHFAADFQGTKVFTKNGPADIQTINPSAFSITIAPEMAAAAAKSQLEMLLNMSKESGYKISDLTTKHTIIKGYSAYYISYVETDAKQNYKNIVFNSFIIKENTAIIFVSGDLNNGMYADKFKRTFYSIKL